MDLESWLATVLPQAPDGWACVRVRVPTKPGAIQSWPEPLTRATQDSIQSWTEDHHGGEAVRLDWLDGSGNYMAGRQWTPKRVRVPRCATDPLPDGPAVATADPRVIDAPAPASPLARVSRAAESEGDRSTVVMLALLERQMGQNDRLISAILEGDRTLRDTIRETTATATAASKVLREVKVAADDAMVDLVGQVISAHADKSTAEAAATVAEVRADAKVKGGGQQPNALEVIREGRQVLNDIRGTEKASPLAKAFHAMISTGNPDALFTFYDKAEPADKAKIDGILEKVMLKAVERAATKTTDPAPAT